jgi:dolichol-phosphate mannosyltransferase
MKTSIIVPVYNEEKSVDKVIDKLLELKIDKEIICVDDGSSDNSLDVLKKYEKSGKIVLLSNKINSGKGFSVRRGIKKARGGIIAIQDADLEYNPKDLEKLVKIMIKDDLEVIFGSRFMRKNKNGDFFYNLGRRSLSYAASFIYWNYIDDMHTCYKVVRKRLLDDFNLKGNGFDLDSEIVAKILRRGIKIREIPIDYRPRGHEEGKHIKMSDGFICLWILIKYRFSKK